MTTTDLEQINEAISRSNPFAIKFVGQHNIWGEGFPDVKEINATAFNALVEAVKEVDEKASSVGITITGERGLGKTQLISRIRHHFQATNSALFLYMGNYGNLNYLKPEFLQALTLSLKRECRPGVTQWQNLASMMICDVLPDHCFTIQELERQCPFYITEWTNSFLNKRPEIDNPYLVRAILWTLSSVHASYATMWLSGRELHSAKADELKLPDRSEQQDDISAFTIACEILDLIGLYITPVICFDELDDPGVNDAGFTRPQIVASLAKDIRNRIKRVVVFLAMYPETLRDDLKFGTQGTGAAYDRTANKVIELEHLNSTSASELVKKWLEKFYSQEQIIPPHPLYPFNLQDIEALGNEKPTARRVIEWCSENWKVPKPDQPDPKPDQPDQPDQPVPKPDQPDPKPDQPDPKSDPVLPPDPLIEIYRKALAEAEETVKENFGESIAIGRALQVGFKALIGKTVEKVTVEEVNWIDDEVRRCDQGYIHLRVVGQEDGKTVKIGVAVLQDEGGRFQGAALSRLINYQKFDLTRGCLVRSKKLNRGAGAALNYASQLLKDLGGEWVLLREEEIKPLFALAAIFREKDNYEVTEEKILAFIDHQRIAEENPLLREILSDPSGQEPDNLTDDNIPIRIPETM